MNWNVVIAVSTAVLFGVYYYANNSSPHTSSNRDTADNGPQGRVIENILPNVREVPPTRPAPTASSQLKPQIGNNYGASNIIDGRLDTAWVEGVPGPGVGEWVQLDFSALTLISEIQIFPGYGKNHLVFEKNNRIKTIQVQFLDANRQFRAEDAVRIDLEDARRWQKILVTPIRALAVRLVIADVYHGTAYDDTAISEVLFR